jgi:saccharopine dehydrogenase-like NADP-dependent oxidoreductase
MAFRIVVLGGYGQFGARIVRALVGEPQIDLIVAGRDHAQAADLCAKVGSSAAHCEPLALDHNASDFASSLRALQPNLVIHTSGPFQDQSYHVARATIDVGAHYLDLADGRTFVAGIARLQDAAYERRVVVATGASTLPAVSSAVVEHLRPAFARMETVTIGIAPGQRTPRGLATMESILSYCGRAFPEWRAGSWRRVHGWQGLHRVRYRDLGWRWAACCDVPDLELLPASYPELHTVRFAASLELGTAHFGLWLIAWLVRGGMMRRPWARAPTILRLARMLDRCGSDVGGMRVRVTGVDANGKGLWREWALRAGSGHGVEIPCIPAVVIARKLARGEPIVPGARPCRGMMAVEEFDAAVRHLDICWHVYEH